MPIGYFQSDFKDFSDSNKKILVKIANFIFFLAEKSKNAYNWLACVAVFINCIHLSILTRKSMGLNSINIIMIGICICDLVNMSYAIYDIIFLIVHPNDKCTPPLSYAMELLDYWLLSFQDITRRMTSFFGVLMTIVRFFIIKFALNRKFDTISKARFAICSIAIGFVLSSGITLFFWLRYEFVEVKPWIPPKKCSQFPPNYTVSEYMSTMAKAYSKADQTPLLTVFTILDGLSKIIPAVIYPIFTFLLIQQLRAAIALRRKTSTSMGSRLESTKSDQTTKMVILMTVTFTISEGPIGICYILEGTLPKRSVFRDINYDLMDAFTIFVAINASVHFLICLGVHSQYRKSAKELLFCERIYKNLKTSRISVTSTTSQENVPARRIAIQ
ncbi:G-protein coupled receptors family 1 profile domain-containing protein [Caenorhabditis elegans]|uniref:G-protein coupled receptors family 1 profile domain-containing protein n=1 Tax=Caenorhabditis elegans TaxID=6239 RepID=O76620_CAEEL|nr:G-protein coupled receptors family 1 profile domain-containing protein [Caenorhabditis elegans]CCD71454.1 G-protein coupled receptors family 1 profile domain-containing protein [Caenorhabditis elegans]|eukprot:NP_493936.2 Serpentine Receptor, class W [Caenorhabditis elegans]